MRHHGRTAASTVGVRGPRRCLRFLWIVAFTLSAHALVVMIAWQASVSQGALASPRLALRWVQAVATRAVVVVEPAPALSRTRAEPAKARTALPIEPTPSPPSATPVAVAAAASEPIRGIAFAMPRIGLPGTAPARWMNPPAALPVSVPTPAAIVAQVMQAQAAREASDAQHRGLAEHADAD